MNNFDNVFSVVKEQCGDKEIIEDAACFDRISEAAHIPSGRIDFYLDTLASIGLIKYSIGNGYIKLTKYGKQKKQVFS